MGAEWPIGQATATAMATTAMATAMAKTNRRWSRERRARCLGSLGAAAVPCSAAIATAADGPFASAAWTCLPAAGCWPGSQISAPGLCPCRSGCLWFGLCLHSTAPCAPLPPMWGACKGEAESVSTPCPFLALPTPPHRHPLHARASGLAAAARLGPPTSARCSLPPVLPAARANGTRAAQSRAYSYKQSGGHLKAR